MTISVLMPAYRAQATIARAVSTVIAQSFSDWELVVVADDDADYATLLDAADIDDERLRFVSTGRIGSGCHHTRNVGLATARGEFIAHLDADDAYSPVRLDTLLPLAGQLGAVVDNPRVVRSGIELYRPFHNDCEIGIAPLLDLTVPLFPLMARELAEPRLPGIELAEDVVANLRLIDRIGTLRATANSLSDYHVVAGSLSHSDASANGFERSYTALIERLENGDRLGLSAANADVARDGLLRKREFNRAFAAARSADSSLDFQTFAARQRR